MISFNMINRIEDSSIQPYLQQNIYFHPKLLIQDIDLQSIKKKFIEKIPLIIPFNGYKYKSCKLFYDWDHNLPSRKVFARLYCFYSDKTAKLALQEYQIKMKEINKVKDFPEFNTVDFSKLTSDEAYTFILNKQGDIRKILFEALWKKNFSKITLRKISRIVLKSDFYKQISKNQHKPCGPIRILSWVPPCKTYLDRWTIDVRYISYCEKNSIWGRIFYVDLQNEIIVKIDNFNMRI